MRTASTATRLAAVGAAALLGLGGPALPTALADDNSFATPPPVVPSLVPGFEPPAPDTGYQQKNACVRSTVATRIEGASWGQNQLRLPEAWRFATGRNQVVAVIDTGVNQHPRLAGRLSGGGDYVEGGKDGTSDCDGHGTEVAGIIAASRDPNTGFQGVAPDSRLLSIRQSSANFQAPDPLSQGGQRPAGTVETLARAVRVAVDRGATVINMSITACAPAAPISREARELQAAARYAVDHNVVVVAAAGNRKTDLSPGCEQQNDDPDPNKVNVIAMPPWFSDDVLSVAAADADGTPAPFTIWGPWVRVAAPGTQIISLDPASSGLTNQEVQSNGQAAPIQGTSFASPYVAGVAALVRERFPSLTARQVMHRIEATAQHPDGTGGRNNKLGFGMVNPVAALTAVLPEEKGVAPARIAPIRTSVGQSSTNRTPVLVALIGAGTGVGLLLITLFVVHATRRVRRRAAGNDTDRS
jgi:membrane-anchored mycosin MYCP